MTRTELRARLDAAVEALNPAMARAMASGTVPAALVVVVVDGEHPAAPSLAGASGRRLPDGSACGLLGHSAARSIAGKLSPQLVAMLDRPVNTMTSHCLVIGVRESLAVTVRWIDATTVGAQA